MTAHTDTRDPVRVVLLGPPGAGKGTQAALLAERLGVPAVSTGDIFRANVDRGTELGRQAREYMDAGEYVPDGVTNGMVALRLQEPDARSGFLLDGYPRTTAQVHALDDMLAAAGTRLDAVLEITANADVVVERLLRRAVEQNRNDDTEDVVRHRLAVYAKQTAPLAAAYASRGLLVSVDGEGAVVEVHARAVAALQQLVGERDASGVAGSA